MPLRHPAGRFIVSAARSITWRKRRDGTRVPLVPFTFCGEARVKRMNILLIAGALTALALPLAGQTAADSAAIRATALDYVEGWYTGDAARMERAVHPELAKRIVQTNPQGRSGLGQQSAMTLVLGTRNGGGRTTPPEQMQKDVVILDI